MMALPCLNYKKQIISKPDEYVGSIYIATIYYLFGEWHCDFIETEDLDTLLSFTGKTAIEAVTNAYKYCNQLKTNI